MQEHDLSPILYYGTAGASSAGCLFSTVGKCRLPCSAPGAILLVLAGRERQLEPSKYLPAYDPVFNTGSFSFCLPPGLGAVAHM